MTGEANEIFGPQGRGATGFCLAATSFTWPSTVAENCRRLAGRFDEAAVVMFETEACLDYGPGDLSDDLPGLGLKYHVHLPLDLPWQTPEAAFRAVECLTDMTAYLDPWAYVLHPPPDGVCLSELARFWRDQGKTPGSLLLENTEDRALSEVWDAVLEHGFGVCLDLGHLLAYAQEDDLELPGLWDRVRMAHVYSPGPGARHEALSGLNSRGLTYLMRVLENLCPGSTVVLEVFSPEDLFESQRFFRYLARDRGFDR